MYLCSFTDIPWRKQEFVIHSFSKKKNYFAHPVIRNYELDFNQTWSFIANLVKYILFGLIYNCKYHWMCLE